MRRMTSRGVVRCSSPVAGSGVQFKRGFRLEAIQRALGPPATQPNHDLPNLVQQLVVGIGNDRLIARSRRNPGLT